MLRRHPSLIIATLLIVLVMAACIVRTGRPVQRRGYAPAPAEHGKHKKPKKHGDRD